MSHKIIETTTHDYNPVNKYIDENRPESLKYYLSNKGFIYKFSNQIFL